MQDNINDYEFVWKTNLKKISATNEYKSHEELVDNIIAGNYKPNKMEKLFYSIKRRIK